MDRMTKGVQIGEIKARFDKMTAAVFLDFKGMTVEHVTKLRAEFRKAGVEYKVVKNTLVKHALKDVAYKRALDDVLVGMTGIAWSYEDPSAAAKVVKAFRKDPAGEKLQLPIAARVMRVLLGPNECWRVILVAQRGDAHRDIGGQSVWRLIVQRRDVRI